MSTPFYRRVAVERTNMAQNNYAKIPFDPRKPQSLEYFEKEGPVRRHPEFHSKLIDNFEGRKTVYSLVA